MQNETEENEELKIDLGEIGRYLLKQWWIILVSTIVCLVAGFIAGKVMKKTVYKSVATYVVSYSGSNVNENNTGLTLTYYVMANSLEILSRDSFYDAALDRIKTEGGETVKNLTVKELKEYITFSSTSQTDRATMIYMKAVTKDAKLSYEIVNALAGEYTNDENETTTFIFDYVKGKYALADGKVEFSQIDALKEAEEPEKDSSVRNGTLIGAAGGLIVSILVLSVVCITDKRVRNEEDLEEQHHAPVLGSIPDVWDKKSGGVPITVIKK